MYKKQILRLFAAMVILFWCIISGLSDFGINILGSLDLMRSVAANYVLLVLLFISVLYLVFVPDIEKEDDSQKKRMDRFGVVGIIVIIICFPLKFYYPKAEFLIVLFTLLVLYYVFFLRQRTKLKTK